MPRNRALIAVPAVDPDLLNRARAWGRSATPAERPRAEAPEPTVEGTVATMRIYDAIDAWGGPWGMSAKEFAEALSALPADVSEIRLHLNSPGGDVFEGITILNMLRGHAARVLVVVDGLAASIASVIAMAGDELVMCPNTSMMVHDAWGLCLGNAADMTKTADLLDHVSDNIAAVYQGKAGDTAGYWRAVMQAETWYSADEAVAAGLADSVAESAASVKAAFDLSAFRFAGRAAAPAPDRLAACAKAPNPKGARMGRTAVEGSRIAGAVPAHDTEVVARSWDPGKVTAALGADLRGSQLRSVFAWVDPEGDPELAASYAYPHHHGVDGAANLRAAVAGIARLNGAAGGPGVPDEDRQAVYDHLAAHVRDAGREPAPLHDGIVSDETFAQHAARVLAETSGLIEAASRVVALRAGAGKSLSKANTDVLDWIGDDLDRLKALCTTNPIPDDGPSAAEVEKTYLDAIARLAMSREDTL